MIGSVYEITSICRSSTEQNMLNVLHFRVESFSGVEITPIQLANDISPEFAAIWIPWLVSVVGSEDRYVGVKVRQVLPTITAPVYSTVGAGIGASTAAGPLPTQVSLPFTLRASSAPASVRGRLFAPRGAIGDLSVTGRVNATTAAALQALLAPLLTANFPANATGADVTQMRAVVYSRKHAAVYPISTCTPEADWGQVRRRSGLNRTDTPIP